MHELIDARIRFTGTIRELGLRQTERFEKLVYEHLRRMRGRTMRWRADHDCFSLIKVPMRDDHGRLGQRSAQHARRFPWCSHLRRLNRAGDPEAATLYNAFRYT
jgi:hypothetical protein